MRLLSLAGLLSVAALVSCSSDETAPPPPQPIKIADLQAAAESANCDYLVRCSWMPDKATCKSLDGADYELLQLIADAVFGKVHYDEKAARAWVEAVRSQKCELGEGIKKALEAAWEPVFTGTVKEGGACFVDDECAGKNVCDLSGCSSACCAGTCSPPPPAAKEGEPCDFTIACEDQTFCGIDDGSGGAGGGGGGTGMQICKPRADNGQPCLGQQGCQDGQLCDVGGSDKCYKLSPDGSPCNPGLQYSCLEYNHFCDESTSKCIALPGAGEPCAPTSEYCAYYAYCDVNGTKLCNSKPVEGEPCDPDGVRCLGDLVCNGSTCARRPPIQTCVGEGMMPGTGGGGGAGGN